MQRDDNIRLVSSTVKPVAGKYYVVAKGNQPGIYDSWPKAEVQVKGFGGAVFKGFKALIDAEDWFEEVAGEAPVYHFAKPLISDESQPKQPTIKPNDALAEGKVVVYTDGGAIDNPGPGGYGVVLLFGAPPKTVRKELSGGFRHTTNNRMEIIALITALGALKRHSDVVVYSDSRYVINSIEKGWALRWRENNWERASKSDASEVEGVPNADLWAHLLELLTQHTVSFVWLKGHGGVRENERCDQLAREATRRPDLPDDEGMGK